MLLPKSGWLQFVQKFNVLIIEADQGECCKQFGDGEMTECCPKCLCIGNVGNLEDVDLVRELCFNQEEVQGTPSRIWGYFDRHCAHLMFPSVTGYKHADSWPDTSAHNT